VTTTTTIPPVACAVNASHRAAEEVEIMADGIAVQHMVCRACRIEMEMAAPRGVSVRVIGEAAPPTPRAPWTPPPVPPRDLSSWSRHTVANPWGLPKNGAKLLIAWQASPRTVHTTESAAEVIGCSANYAQRILRELAAIGMAQRKPHPRTKCVILYHLTTKGERA
jgi:hypothetical protein